MHILRTWYWFSINRYDGLSYKSTVTHIFYGINLLYELSVSTLNWGDEKNSLKGKKDKATSMHEVCYLRMQIIMTMNGMTQERLNQCHLTLHDFPAYYISNCSICTRLSTYQGISKCYRKQYF